MTDNSIRLNKYISDSGYCSRREADKLIDSNRVRINGKRPELGTRVTASDVVTVDGQTVLGSATSKTDRVYIVYNKPFGITCTTERHVKGNIIDAIDHDRRIFPIGRLDKPSEGLILLTSDGDIVNKILRAENAHEKAYLVTVNRSINADFASKMAAGVPILGTVTKPCKVHVVGRNQFKITLTQGLNRQIRRMCDYLDYEVVQLVRLRIMNIELGKLKPGQWRNLNPHEIEQLNQTLAGSISEAVGQRMQPAKRRVGDRKTEVARGSTTTRKTAKSPAQHKPAGETRKPMSRGKKAVAHSSERSGKAAQSGKSSKQPPENRKPSKKAADKKISRSKSYRAGRPNRSASKKSPA